MPRKAETEAAQANEAQIQQIVAQINRERNYRIPHLAEFLEDLLREMRGSRQLAHRLIRGLNKCKPGSLAQIRFLQAILRMLELHQRENNPSLSKIGELSDEELEAEYLRTIGQVMQDAGRTGPTTERAAVAGLDAAGPQEPAAPAKARKASARKVRSRKAKPAAEAEPGADRGPDPDPAREPAAPGGD